MSDAARLDEIEWRRDIDGCPAHTDCLRADVAYLLTLARKQAAALERVERLCKAEDARQTAKSFVPVDAIRAALGDGDE